MCLNEVRRQGGTPCLWPLWRGPYLSRQKPKGENWMVSGRRRLHKAPPLAVRGLGFKLKRVLRSASSDKPLWCEEADVDYGLLLIFTGQGGPDGYGVIIRHRPLR